MKPVWTPLQRRRQRQRLKKIAREATKRMAQKEALLICFIPFDLIADTILDLLGATG